MHNQGTRALRPSVPFAPTAVALAATHAHRHRAEPCQRGIYQAYRIRTCRYSCAWIPVKHYMFLSDKIHARRLFCVIRRAIGIPICSCSFLS